MIAWRPGPHQPIIRWIGGADPGLICGNCVPLSNHVTGLPSATEGGTTQPGLVRFITRYSRWCLRPVPSLRTSTFWNGRRSSRSWLPASREGSGRRGGDGAGSELFAVDSAFGRSFHSGLSPPMEEGAGSAAGSTSSRRIFRGRPGLRLGEGKGSPAIAGVSSAGRSVVCTLRGRPRGRFCGTAVSSEGAGAEVTASGSIACSGLVGALFPRTGRSTIAPSTRSACSRSPVLRSSI